MRGDRITRLSQQLPREFALAEGMIDQRVDAGQCGIVKAELDPRIRPANATADREVDAVVVTEIDQTVDHSRQSRGIAIGIKLLGRSSGDARPPKAPHVW